MYKTIIFYRSHTSIHLYAVYSKQHKNLLTFFLWETKWLIKHFFRFFSISNNIFLPKKYNKKKYCIFFGTKIAPLNIFLPSFSSFLTLVIWLVSCLKASASFLERLVGQYRTFFGPRSSMKVRKTKKLAHLRIFDGLN